MQKTDITESHIYIKNIINVVKSENTNHHKRICVNGRHSDAFVYIISGNCTYAFSDGTGFVANEGDVIYLAHNAVYSMYINTGSYRFIFCDFEFDSLYERKSGIYSGQKLTGIESVFTRLFHSHKKSDITESVSLLYSIYSSVIGSCKEQYINKNTMGRIDVVRSFMDKNLTDNSISVSEMAKMIGMSEGYFRKLFLKQFRIKPSQYIILRRIDNAKKLMQYPFMTIEECALQSGFSTVQYFGRVFKKNTGITPAQYRKKEYGIGK